MNPVILLTCVVAVVVAQRPGYAGSRLIGYPGLASRFKDENESTTPFVNNRLGEEGGTTPKIPVDARGDADLVNWINQWPRRNRPFWALNADHVEAQRGGASSQQSNSVQQGQTGLQQGGLQPSGQDAFLGNRGNFESDFVPIFEPDFNLDWQPGPEFVLVDSRSSFGGDEPETIPARPNVPRSSFLRPLH